MMIRRLKTWTALMLVFVASYNFDTVSAPQTDLTSATGHSNNSVGGSETLDGLSKKNCSLLGATNISQVEENVTSTALGCLEEEIDIPERPPFWIRVRHLWVLHIFNVVALWSVVANSLPLAAIIKHEALHKPVYILMANMAASDVVAGVTFGIAFCTILFYGKAGLPLPNALLRFVFTSCLISALSSAYSLLALTAERYWFIVHGMTYENQITNDRCKVVIIVVWMWSSVLALLPVFGWSCTYPSQVGCIELGGGSQPGYLVMVLILVFVPMAAIMLFNLGVFRCLWRQVSDIRRQEAAVQAQPTTSRKSSITVLIITVVFLAGWLPWCVLVANEVACKGDGGNMDPSMVASVLLNSAVNPVIYGFRLEEIRRNVKRLFVGRAVNAWSP
uniref:G-protein coupled receptors family 1 profile domain-containing protein n=1 Tax=Branchiostoma floridae TaxID=7739 RepID=C3XWW4_BRAFL|eukprot:XP_002611214.1 hypothetical protein BRAFLDRAFT_71174 [Branchiostoma floridae]